MGNSEVGHINIGAGRIVYQNLARINKDIANDEFSKKETLLAAFEYAKQKKVAVHLVGLLSDGGIHSHINHLKGILEVAAKKDANHVFLHAFTDGRDCDPKSGIDFVKEIQQTLEKTTGELATVCGRYYAMDRDHRWERIKIAYDALVHGIGTKTKDVAQSIQANYDDLVTDEFLKPLIAVDEKGKPKATIKENDVVIFFNFRTDRGRELTEVLTQKDHPNHTMKKLPLHFVTMTNYDENFKNIQTIYNSKCLKNTLGEVLEKAGKNQLRVAETEKYPHVTFFFSGGREERFKGEERLLCPSPKVATYDLAPEMSAYEIRDALIPALKQQKHDFICLNFANGDMVGHTGVLSAAIKACETVDTCVKNIVEVANEEGYTTIIIADHGNCEQMANKDGSPHTAHTTNPVPIILLDPDIKTIKSGVLGNIAPTILKIMGVAKPEEMSEDALV
jgi:2,3-bisphosphoglycerate-independent phosphoglycerate mutase